tara:strand:+ start:1723 stop:1932 length:210 start_codon:yes stop_codon:yes gene_type:complete
MRQFNPSISAYMNINKIKLDDAKPSAATGLLSPMRMPGSNRDAEKADPAARVAYHVKAIREKRQKKNGV